MVKRASALVLAFLLVLVLLPSTALAVETYTASNADEFRSVAADAMSGDTINLTADVDCTFDHVTIQSGVQVNCNSYVLTISGDYFDNYGTITGNIIIQISASMCTLGGTINGNLVVPSRGGSNGCDVIGTVNGNFDIGSGLNDVTGGTIQNNLTITSGMVTCAVSGTTGSQPTVNGNISVSNATLIITRYTSLYPHTILTIKSRQTLTIGDGSTVSITSGNYIQTEIGGRIVNSSAQDIPIKLANGSDYIVAAGTTFVDPVTISIAGSGTFPVGQASATIDVTVARGLEIYFTEVGHEDYFTSAIIDEMPLSAAVDFTGEDGSIILHINQSYLNTLAPGTHLLRVNTSSGYFAETNIVVTVLGDDADIPTTGDKATPWLWVGLSIVAITGLIVLAARRKRGL